MSRIESPSTSGAWTIQRKPSTAIVINHSTITGPKSPSDTMSAVALNHEQPDQDHDRNRHDPGGEHGRCDLQSFDCAEDADGRRDHAFAEEQRSTHDPEGDENRGALTVSSAVSRGQEAVRDRMPPSPWLSARMTMPVYLIEMTRSSA